MTPLNKIALALPFLVFLAIYGASVGHGFVADDFGWILDSRIHDLHDLRELFFKSSGFYRPVVGLTFAADYALFGTHPLGFGLTNVLFAGSCAVLLFLVARELALPEGAALLAVVLWLLNPHGICPRRSRCSRRRRRSFFPGSFFSGGCRSAGTICRHAGRSRSGGRARAS